jgi:hypothetical protein
MYVTHCVWHSQAITEAWLEQTEFTFAAPDTGIRTARTLTFLTEVSRVLHNKLANHFIFIKNVW